MFQRGRRAFKPPRPRRRQSFRQPRHSFDGAQWRYWTLGAGLRLLYAAGFLLVPSLTERLGDAAVVAICLLLGTLAIVVSILTWNYTGGAVRRDLVADALTLLLVVPVVAVAVSIQVADVRFGGRGSHFLAAAVAVLLTFLIVIVLASFAGTRRDRVAQIAALPAALVIAAVIGGAGRFSASGLYKGVALAWFSAVVATFLFGMLPRNTASLVVPVTYTLFAIVVLATSNSAEGASIFSVTGAGLATALTVAVGLVLIGIPLQPGNLRRQPSRRPEAPDQQPTAPTGRQ